MHPYMPGIMLILYQIKATYKIKYGTIIAYHLSLAAPIIMLIIKQIRIKTLHIILSRDFVICFIYLYGVIINTVLNHARSTPIIHRNRNRPTFPDSPRDALHITNPIIKHNKKQTIRNHPGRHLNIGYSGNIEVAALIVRSSSI